MPSHPRARTRLARKLSWLVIASLTTVAIFAPTTTSAVLAADAVAPVANDNACNNVGTGSDSPLVTVTDTAGGLLVTWSQSEPPGGFGTDGTVVVRACVDDEGAWSQNDTNDGEELFPWSLFGLTESPCPGDAVLGGSVDGGAPFVNTQKQNGISCSSEPTATPTTAPTATPTTAPTATPTATPTTAPTATPTATPTTAPTATPTATPTTAPTATPTTAPTATPTAAPTAAPTATPTPVEPALDVLVGSPECDGDVPYLDYEVDAVGTESDTVTITFVHPTDASKDVVYPDLPFSGRVLWPGAVVDADGMPVDWPGWRFDDGIWVEGDDSDWVRPSVEVRFEVDAAASTVTVDYPPSEPLCDANPPEGEVDPATGTPGTTLPPTDTAPGTTAPAGDGWRLTVLALSGLLAAALLLTPGGSIDRRKDEVTD
jgi:hypothetical protein